VVTKLKEDFVMAYYIDILAQLGLSPESFVETILEPIQNPDGQLLILTERRQNSVCPICHSGNVVIKDYYYRFLKVGVPRINQITIQIKRVRYKCKKCGKTFVYPLFGLKNKKQHTNEFNKSLLEQMRFMESFKQIALENKVSISYVLKLFDNSFSYFPRLTMPKILCIDEFYFSRKKAFKYCCVLTNYETGDVIDIIQSRQKPFLKIYFGAINPIELSRVQYFVSDMYDTYSSIRDEYFPKSSYVIDKFHYVKQITEALNRYRVFVMNNITETETKEYCFLKKCWKLFLCRTDDIEYKVKGKKFTCKYMNYEEYYVKMVLDCLKIDSIFFEAYMILQDILTKQKFENYNAGKTFIEFIINRLKNVDNPLFQSVGETYEKWKDPIINCITINKTGYSISNGIAEGTNNLIKTVLKVSYGYKSFKRFRFRALLVLRNKKAKTL